MRPEVEDRVPEADDSLPEVAGMILVTPLATAGCCVGLFGLRGCCGFRRVSWIGRISRIGRICWISRRLGCRFQFGISCFRCGERFIVLDQLFLRIG